MMKMKFLLSSGLFLGLVVNAQAAIVDGYGVTVGANGFADGGEFATSATISIGSANATATYTGSSGTFLPTLSADALSGADGEVSRASAYGVQGYTYSGISKSIAINFNLHGSVADNVMGAAAEDNELLALMTVISSSSIPATSSIFELLLDSPIDPGDFIAFGDASITNGINRHSAGSLTFNVFDGMDFYVAAQIDARAINGFADGSNTFTMQFDDATGLSAVAMSAVPVPAAIWLFGSGLVGLVGFARRKVKD